MQKAQGALEYLLLIGGAVLVVAVVTTLVFSIAETGEEQTRSSADTLFDTLDQRITGGTGSDYIVEFDADTFNSSGICSTPDVRIYVTVSGTQVGQDVFVPMGSTPIQTYSITLPRAEVTLGPHELMVRFEDSCPGGGGDKNIRVQRVSVTQTDSDTAPWEKFNNLAIPQWQSWANGTLFHCYWSPCVRSNLEFQ